MWEGVLKSGSPTPKLITSTPLARKTAALAVICKVKDGLILSTNLDNDIGIYWLIKSRNS